MKIRDEDSKEVKKGSKEEAGTAGEVSDFQTYLMGMKENVLREFDTHNDGSTSQADTTMVAFIESTQEAHAMTRQFFIVPEAMNGDQDMYLLQLRGE
jgi:hypothetical protein